MCVCVVCVCGVCVCVYVVCVCVVCVCVPAVNNNETIHLCHTRWEMRASLHDAFPTALLTDKHDRLNPSGELDRRPLRRNSLKGGGPSYIRKLTGTSVVTIILYRKCVVIVPGC